MSTSISFSPGYVPPETLQGAMPDTPGDVYSLGATLYAMTTGSAPYANGTEPLNLMETVARMASGQRVSPTEFGVAASTAELIEAAMDRNPSARPTMREFARLLRSEAGEAASPPAVKPTSAAPETRTATRIVANPVAEPPIDLLGRQICG